MVQDEVVDPWRIEISCFRFSQGSGSGIYDVRAHQLHQAHPILLTASRACNVQQSTTVRPTRCIILKQSILLLH